jgi:drug/metabolite transporter (DMT)-like permease
VLIATAGVVLVVAARDAGFDQRTLMGDLLTLGAVLCWAGYTLGLRTVPDTVSPLQVTAVTTVAGTPGLVLAAIPQLAGMDWEALGTTEWGALAYSTLFSLLVAYVIWNRSVQTVGPSRTVIYMCLTPLVAVISAAILLGERPQPLQAVGAVLIIGGVLLSRWPGAEPEAQGTVGSSTIRR